MTKLQKLAGRGDCMKCGKTKKKVRRREIKWARTKIKQEREERL